MKHRKTSLRQLSIDEVVSKRDPGDAFHRVNASEDYEFRAGHAAGAVQIGKGVIRRDVETTFPGKSKPIILYRGCCKSAPVPKSWDGTSYTDVGSFQAHAQYFGITRSRAALIWHCAKVLISQLFSF
jgi:hypothetical protein